MEENYKITGKESQMTPGLQVFVKEKQIEGAVIGEGLPVVKSHCPADGNTARQDAKDQLRFLSAQHGDMVNTIVKALQKSHISNW